MNIINDDDIENFLLDIPSDGESFSGVSELDDSDNDKTYTPSNTILHDISASSSDSNDEERYHNQLPTPPANPRTSRSSKTISKPIQQAVPSFEPPYTPPLWGKSELMPPVELFSDDLPCGLAEIFEELEDKSPYNIFCQIYNILVL
ncbi:uncharacterized protein LOC112682942, partial [Sipha flava]|uniref:Uncharacterized protein LOC112682942 n=1 Tax=Sipha flava TaxID=143950 RepID=A0A8B8FFH9_9HEMI